MEQQPVVYQLEHNVTARIIVQGEESNIQKMKDEVDGELKEIIKNTLINLAQKNNVLILKGIE